MANNKDALFNRYKLSSDEELKEITVANGYTEEAEQVARQILEGDRTEYKEYIKQKEENRQKDESNVFRENIIGSILKVIGFLVLILGTVGSVYIGGQGYEFSFGAFILPEIAVIFGGMMILGFSEIIQLLQDIKDRME